MSHKNNLTALYHLRREEMINRSIDLDLNSRLAAEIIVLRTITMNFLRSQGTTKEDINRLFNELKYELESMDYGDPRHQIAAKEQMRYVSLVIDNYLNNW